MMIITPTAQVVRAWNGPGLDVHGNDPPARAFEVLATPTGGGCVYALPISEASS